MRANNEEFHMDGALTTFHALTTFGKPLDGSCSLF